MDQSGRWRISCRRNKNLSNCPHEATGTAAWPTSASPDGLIRPRWTPSSAPAELPVAHLRREWGMGKVGRHGGHPSKGSGQVSTPVSFANRKTGSASVYFHGMREEGRRRFVAADSRRFLDLRFLRDKQWRGSLQVPKEICRVQDWDVSETFQWQKVFFVTADDEVRAGCESTFQHHFIKRVRDRSGGAFDRENQIGRRFQDINPIHALPPRVIQAQFLQGFLVFCQQGRADRRATSSGSPCGQTVKRGTTPETGAHHDIRVENDPHRAVRSRARLTAPSTARSSFAVISGSL